jgi:hypothetical protein
MMHDQGGLAGADYGHSTRPSYMQLEGILAITAAPDVAILLGLKREAEQKPVSSSCWIIVYRGWRCRDVKHRVILA